MVRDLSGKRDPARGTRGRFGPAARCAGVLIGAVAPALLAWFAFLPPAPGAADPPRSDESPRRLEIPPSRVEVLGLPPERVRLSVAVLDREGQPVAGLGAADFLVKEGGVPREIVDFGVERDREDRPLSAVFLVDRSESIGRQMYKWKEACASLLSALRPIDEIQVGTFADSLEVVQPFTRSFDALVASVTGIPEWGSGGTRILRSLDETISSLRSRRGRKVIFLLTDGLEGGVSTEPILRNPYAASLATRAVQGQITVVTILPGPTGVPYMAAQDIAVHTGGWWVYSSDDLPALMARLGERLLLSYYLAYDSMREPGDREKRAVDVTLRAGVREGVTLSTAAGVYGESPLLDHLLEDLDEEEDAELRSRAAAHLGLVDDPEARRPLIAALEDDDPRVRAAAARALAERGEFAAAKAIGRLLEDEDPAVREAALAALGLLLEKGPDEKARARILDTLEAISSP